MKIFLSVILLFSITMAIEPMGTSGFVSTNFANADIEASKQEEDNAPEIQKDGAERRNMKTKGKETKFKAKPFVATGFFLVGAITGYLGYDANQDAKYYKNEYDNSTDPDEIEDLKETISDYEKKRNTYYGISGASFVGLTVTLTLF